MKYNPGPFQINFSSELRQIQIFKLNGAGSHDRWNIVAVLDNSDERQHGQVEAHARLFAAASELLSAAHATLKLWKKHGMGDNHHESDRIFDALVAAIRRAEGK